MKKNSCYFFLLLVIIGHSSCKKMEKAKTGNLSEYLEWINDPANGLSKVKYVNGLEIKIKYMPREYLAYLDLKSRDKISMEGKDSVINLYQHSFQFMMSIGPDEREGNGPDIMLDGIVNQGEFEERVHLMNFEMERYISLAVDEKEFRPVLSTMENVYGMTSARNIVFVFVPGEKDQDVFAHAEKLDLVYDDELFGLGVNHFLFYKENIQDIPEITFWNN